MPGWYGCLVSRRIGTDVYLDSVAPPPAVVLDSGLARSLLRCRGGSANPETVGVEILRIAA